LKRPALFGPDKVIKITFLAVFEFVAERPLPVAAALRMGDGPAGPAPVNSAVHPVQPLFLAYGAGLRLNRGKAPLAFLHVPAIFFHHTLLVSMELQNRMNFNHYSV
jgi:hypothetical protein